MKSIFRILLLACVAALAASCCACRSYQKRTRRPLEGTRWQLVQLDGQDVVCEAGRYTIALRADDGTLAGTGDCNRLRGRYEATPERALRIGPLTSTRMACPEGSREGKFLSVLQSATHYDMDGPLLLLLCDGEIKAVFQAQTDEGKAE